MSYKSTSRSLDATEDCTDQSQAMTISYSKGEILVCQSKPAFLHQPTCSETQLSLRLNTILRQFNWDQKWMGHVPIRIGHNRSLDLAVAAYLEAQTATLTDSWKTRASGVRLYLEAIDSVQAMMNAKSFWTSEEAQLAVGVLSAYESTKGASLRHMFAHKQGLLTLLLRSTQATEVVRAMVYDETAGAYLVAIAKGIPSPFDSKFWLELKPTLKQAPTQAAFTLRTIAYRQSLRLPRLMVHVRKLREGLTDLRAISDAVELASEMFAEQDCNAENDLLHCVVITTPRYSEDMKIISVGMKFGSLAEFEAAIYYWQTRILLHRLCAKIYNLFPRHTRFDLEAINNENGRLAKNLLMSWESAFDQGAFGTIRGGAGTTTFSLAMIAVWGVLVDVNEFCGRSSEEVREWVLERFQILMNRGIGRISEKQMDEMADLFAGGPVRGVIPYMIGHGPE